MEANKWTGLEGLGNIVSSPKGYGGLSRNLFWHNLLMAWVIGKTVALSDLLIIDTAPSNRTTELY